MVGGRSTKLNKPTPTYIWIRSTGSRKRKVSLLWVSIFSKITQSRPFWLEDRMIVLMMFTKYERFSKKQHLGHSIQIISFKRKLAGRISKRIASPWAPPRGKKRLKPIAHSDNLKIQGKTLTEKLCPEAICSIICLSLRVMTCTDFSSWDLSKIRIWAYTMRTQRYAHEKII